MGNCKSQKVCTYKLFENTLEVKRPPKRPFEYGIFYELFSVNCVLEHFPGYKFRLPEAGILISLPVAGLRPVLAARSADLKVPKPINAISSPAFTVLTTWAIRASKISLTSALDFPVSSATAATNSVLLNSFLLKKLGFVKSKSKP